MTQKFNAAASHDEIRAYAAAELQAAGLNTIEKLKRRSDLRFALEPGSGSRLQFHARKERDGFADLTNRMSEAEERAWRTLYQARLEWLTLHQGDDMAGEEIVRRRGWAAALLPKWNELSRALDWVAEVDEYDPNRIPREGEERRAPTFTYVKLQDRCHAVADEIRSYLLEVLTGPQVDLLIELSQVSRRQKRYVLERMNESSSALPRLGFTHIALHSSVPVLFHAHFHRCIEEARTAAEIRQLCAAWQTDATGYEVDKRRVFFADEITAEGFPQFFIRPVEVSSDSCRGFMGRHLRNRCEWKTPYQ